MSKEESLLNKIRKLIEKANSTDSEAEAEAFMLHAQKLIREHNIEAHKIESFESKKLGVGETQIKITDRWEDILINSITKYNFCKAINMRGGNISVIGNPANVEICIYLFSFFKNAALNLSLKAYDGFIKERIAAFGFDADFDFGKQAQNQYIANYLLGASSGITKKLQDEWLEAAKQSEISAVMVVNDTAISTFISEHFGKLKSGRSGGKIKNSGAYERGKADGRGIKVNSGVVGSNNSKIN